MSFFKVLVSNDILNSAFIAWFLAQLYKVITHFRKEHEFSFERVVGSGGMPSSHTSFVSALTISVWKTQGFASPIFALSVAFSVVVMYDAAGVRRAAGEQAKLLNKMVAEWKYYDNDFRQKQLKELLGHSKKEVLVGLVLGITVALVYNYLKFGY